VEGVLNLQKILKSIPIQNKKNTMEKSNCDLKQENTMEESNCDERQK
jgi:hypothetical protein